MIEIFSLLIFLSKSFKKLSSNSWITPKLEFFPKLILLSTSGMIYLFYTTKDFPTFLKNSLFFEPIKVYSIKIIEKIVNFI